MIKTSIEKLASDIGFDIANSDDQAQADLLNGLGKGFGYLRDDQLEIQLCYIVDKLTPVTKELIKKLTEFITLTEEK